MATVRVAERVTLPPPGLRPYRFTVRQYRKLIDFGIFRERDRTELLEGCVISRRPHTPPHAATVSIICQRLFRRVPDDWLLRFLCSVETRDSLPEPDVSVVRGPEEAYFKRYPRPLEVALIVEVADTSLADDRGRKARVYARAPVPVYWIVNLIDGQVEVYTRPRAGRSPAYRDREDFRPRRRPARPGRPRAGPRPRPRTAALTRLRVSPR